MENDLTSSNRKSKKLVFKSNFKKEQVSKIKNDFLSCLNFHLHRVINNIPTYPKIKRIPAFILCVACTAIPFALVLKPVVSVRMGGKHIAFAQNTGSVNLAKDLLQYSISRSNNSDFEFSNKIEFARSFSISDNVESTEQLIKSIANSSDDICLASAISVNGQIIGACILKDDTTEVLKSLLDEYKSNPSDKASFVQDVKVSTLPILNDNILTSDELLQRIKNDNILDVQVISTEQHTETVPYQTRKIESDQIEQGVTKTMQVGRNGIASVTEQVVSLNGIETQRSKISSTVLTPATDCIIAIGTKSNGVGTGQLIVPISSYRFSSGFKLRNGIWHKGVDLAAPVGTAVYAADNGIVTTAKLSDSFGNYIVIDHQNGMQTLYAHNSSLIVKQGDVVSKGQQIALSGNTGNSTGPHLHFEVHSNDVAVNPCIYLSFNSQD